MNLYAYVGNNPLNFVDPMGLCKEQERKDKTDEGIDKTKKPPKPPKKKGQGPVGGGGKKGKKPWWKKAGDWIGDKLDNANWPLQGHPISPPGFSVNLYPDGTVSVESQGSGFEFGISGPHAGEFWVNNPGAI